MRLINISNLQLEQHVSKVPPYAILSHRWSSDPNDEATLQQWQKWRRTCAIPAAGVYASYASGLDVFSSPHPDESEVPVSGMRKVLDFCVFAKAQSHGWVWIDTVCIDKTNSVELSEAINSMFRWYKQFVCCYVYMQDVVSDAGSDVLHKSKWFSRGWTLQELLAPSSVVFSAHDWRSLGAKEELKAKINEITAIPVEALESPERIPLYSIAQRMS